VWQAAHALTLRVYEVTRRLPRTELYGLTTQLRRSAASIAANIAEGRMRSSEGAFASFLEIASASASETDYSLLLSHELGYLSSDEYSELSQSLISIRKQLSAFRRTLRAAAGRAVGSSQRPTANGQRLS
jgi:four helix bundle protein